jgi:hypothetical protein
MLQLTALSKVTLKMVCKMASGHWRLMTDHSITQGNGKMTKAMAKVSGKRIAMVTAFRRVFSWKTSLYRHLTLMKTFSSTEAIDSSYYLSRKCSFMSQNN